MGKMTHTISIRNDVYTGTWTDPAVSASGRCSGNRIRKFYVLISMVVSFLAANSFAYQKKDSEEKAPPAAMTEEEKEMMHDREMLENLALLKDLDAIAFMDLLNEMDPEWSEKDEPVLPENEPGEKEEEGDKP